MKYIKIGLTITLILTIISTIILLLAIIIDAKIVQGYNLIAWYFVYFYFLFPIILILLAILIISNLKSSGILGLNNLKWDFIMLLLVIIIFSQISVLKNVYSFKEKFLINIYNSTNQMIEILKIHGRHDLLELVNIEHGRKYLNVFRGKQIDYRTKNYFENNIYLDYFINNKVNSKIIVNTWSEVTSDTLKITIFRIDSVVIDY